MKKLTPSKNKKIPTIKEYAQTLSDIKKHIKAAQIKAALAANKELLKLYWYIGNTISEKQQLSSWGSNIIEKLAHDLQNSCPGIAGFSRTNVFQMKAFFEAYEKIPQLVGQFEELPIFNIPWGHNAILLEKPKNTGERLWYAKKTIANG